MCRLFGFKSIIKSKVHSSLVHAENALGIQSVDHPDGWGVCYFIGNSPHIIKADKPAIDCDIFQKVSGTKRSVRMLCSAKPLNLRRHEPDPKPDRAWCREGHELKEAHELKLPCSSIGLRAPARPTPSPSTTLIRVGKFPAAWRELAVRIEVSDPGPSEHFAHVDEI